MCNCIDKIDEKLAEQNTQIKVPFMLGGREPLPFIATEKIDRKKRVGPIALTGAFCPFCGKAYPKTTEAPHV